MTILMDNLNLDSEVKSQKKGFSFNHISKFIFGIRDKSMCRDAVKEECFHFVSNFDASVRANYRNC